MSGRARWTAVLLAVGLGLSAASLAGAQVAGPPAPTPPISLDATYEPIVVEGRQLFEVGGDGKLTAAQRAARINRRLRNLILREPPVLAFGSGDIRTQAGQVVITLGGEPVMAVTPGDAQDNLSTPQELAQRWGDLLFGAVQEARMVRQNPLSGAGILIRNSGRDLLLSTIAWLPRLAGALFLIVLFWFLAQGTSWLARTITERGHMDQNLVQLSRAIGYYGTWLVGGVAILSTLGLQASGLVAALGVSGFVLGFAFKDILSHFLAGLALLVGRTFRIGDQIVVRDQEGTVERIELRALYLRTYDNRLVIIPNAEVFSAVITSNTASPHRRRDFVVGVGYAEDIDRARQEALDAVRSTPGVLAEPGPEVLVDELAASTVNLRIRFYTNSLRADYLKVGSECMQRVKEAFDRERISMPSQIQTVVLDNVSELAQTLAMVGCGVDDEGRLLAPSSGNAITRGGHEHAGNDPG